MIKFAKLFELRPEGVQVLFYLDWEGGEPGLRCIVDIEGQRVEVFYGAESGEGTSEMAKILKNMDEEGARRFIKATLQSMKEVEAEARAVPSGGLH